MQYRTYPFVQPFLCITILYVVFILGLAVAPVAAQGTEADVYVGLGIVAFEEKRYPEALAHLRQALDIEPENIDALYYTGLVLIAQLKSGAAVEPLEKAREKAPDDLAILFQLGVAYFILQQYDKAEPLLAKAFRERPQTDNLGYYVGFMRYRQKDYKGALEAFKAGASKDPDIQELTRFYAGLALAILGRPEQAVAQIEEAQRVRTGSALTAPLERLRDTLVAREESERRLRAQVRLGGYYDSNVAVIPLSGNDPAVAILRGRDADSAGFLTSINLDYSWLRQGPVESTIGYTFFQTINADGDLSNFDLTNHQLSLGLFYRGMVQSMPFQVGAQYSFDSLELGGDRFLGRNTGTIFATLVEDEHNLTSLLGRLQGKDFEDRFLAAGQAENRDADHWLVGVTHIFRFSGDKHLLRVGYQYDNDDAKGQNWFYRGHRWLAGAQYTLPWEGIRLQYNFDFHYRRYPNSNTTFPTTAPNTVKQRVREQNHILRIEKPLPERNLTLALDYQATISRSNLDALFSYNRHIVTGSVTWVY